MKTDKTTQTVLINGICCLSGARIASLLSEDEHLRVIGLGRTEPVAPVGRAEVHTATLNGSQMVAFLRAEHVDVVVHLEMAGEEQPARSREDAIQHNVLNTMELLGACAAASVKRVVVRSSTLVYGAHHTLPMLIGEEYPIARPGQPGLLRDYIELEQFAEQFAAKHPETTIVRLRCAGLVGSGVWSPLANYLLQSSPPALLGFDPRIQVLHLEDAATAFVLAATTENIAGAFNIASDGVVTLNQAIRLSGRLPAQVPDVVADMAAQVGFGRVLLAGWPYERAALRYSCVADTQRARDVLGWSPAYDAETALREMHAGEHLRKERANPLSPFFGNKRPLN